MISIGKDCNLDLEKLIATRLLVNANSGGGKSFLIRRLLEQSYGQVQQILIDLEGEFITLREEFDYLLVGKDGEIPASIRTAELLAKRLLELNVSTIIDLSELKHPERITFVKRFLDSLVNAPKELWHPCLVVVDEAHQFCPEGAKSESASAVIDLMTRGRKRGFCGVLATQRISKLNKDAVAEANNYMTGRTILDIDVKRASDVLGFTSKEDTKTLRDLQAGEFYSFGSAFEHTNVEKIKVGEVKTTHPDRTKGRDISKPIETPENIKKLLKDIIDLPKEADEELRTTADMKKKIQELKTKLTLAERTQKVEQKIQEKTVNVTDEKALQKAKDEGFKEAERFYKSYITPMEQNTKALKASILKLVKNSQELLESRAFSIVGDMPIPTPLPVAVKSILKSETKIVGKKGFVYAEKILAPRFAQELNGIQPLRAGAMKMLNWLAGVYPKELSKQRLATLSGFSANGGTFNTYISELKKNGWIVGQNEFSITNEGLQNAQAEELPSGEELLSLWQSKFREGARKILQVLYQNYPNEVSKEQIGMETGFEPSGGTFNTYLSELRRNNLIEVGEGIKISGEFFE